MANTDIKLINNNGLYVPSADSIPVVSGDTVSFTTSDGKPAIAFWSPDAISVLSPTPTNPFSFGPGGKAEFSFKSSNSGAYSVYFGTDADTPPSSFPSHSSQALLLRTNTSTAPSFDNPLNVGHQG
jgi:hypothetical protein